MVARDAAAPVSAITALSANGGSRLIAQLACRYFHPGGVVRGFVQLATDREQPDATTEIASVVAQLHAHVSVDSNLLTVPVAITPDAVASSEVSPGLSATEIVKFSGESGACLHISAPSLLLSDVNIAPTASEAGKQDDTLRRCRRDFAIALPAKACPTFRGTSARAFYVLSVTLRQSDKPPVSIHLPFDVYASEFAFAPPQTPVDVAPERRLSRKERSASVGIVPVGVRNGSEIPFELRPSLMHGRVETEALQRTQTSVFTIGKDDAHLVKLLLTKQFYHPGDVLLGAFDFSKASIPCLAISATLCLEEVLSTMAFQPNKVVQSKVVGYFHEHTAMALQTNVRFCVPHDAQPTVKTDLVCFQWVIKFEFTTSVAGADSATQVFKWQIPIDVRPSSPRESTRFASIPHRLYTGSSRTVSFA